MHNIIFYLESRQIQYKTEGKNTSRGWIQIKCIFNWCSDQSKHLGIDPSTGFYSCWICGAKGHITKLIKEIDGCSYSEAEKIANQLLLIRKIEEQRVYIDSIHLPKIATKVFPSFYRKYLRDRGYNPAELISRYDLYATDNVSDWKFRIIIPVMQQNKLVAFTGRDVTDKQKLKYKNIENEKAIVPIKSCLYGIDRIKTKVILVEGVFDSWRIGDGSVALFGTQFTHKQVFTLSESNINECIVLFDGEKKAFLQAKKLANILSLYIKKVEVWELERRDPDTMNRNDLKECKQYLKQKGE